MDRRANLLHGLGLATLRGIEFGPLDAPMVGKHESAILYVDHLGQAALRARYPEIDPAGIVPVDVVWSDGRLGDRLPAGALFDYALAAHVVEHVPDLLYWLDEIAAVLRPGGRLGLVVPDKRFTFDYLRAVTRVGEVMEAHLRSSRRPMPGQVYDFTANAVAVDAAAAWAAPLDPASLRRYCEPAWALAESRRAAETGAYIDVHCWVFTPDSFLDVFAELATIGLLPFACHSFTPTERPDIEFAVVLERLAADTPAASVAESFRRMAG